jgi:hypothetical protein
MGQVPRGGAIWVRPAIEARPEVIGRAYSLLATVGRRPRGGLCTRAQGGHLSPTREIRILSVQGGSRPTRHRRRDHV